jgi:DNA-binding cell septation regulator SpoVG
MATATAAAIEVLTISALASAGNLKALVSVRIGPSLVVHKCRVIQQPGQRAWVSMPQERWDGADGQPRYTALVELSGGLRDRVATAILAAAQRQGLITAGSAVGAVSALN